MTIPTQQRRTTVTDWKQAYLDLTADERALVGTSTWNAGWSEGWALGRQAGLDEARRQRQTFQEVLDEVVFRIMQNAGLRNLASDLARSVSLTELDERRYAGVSPQRLAELRSHAAGELRRVRQQHLEAARWAA